MIRKILEEHGEVILHTASGESWEIHKGDQGHLSGYEIVFLDGENQWHHLFLDQVERVTYHRAHPMG